ncbi:MAG: hypothetical protein ACRD0U_09725 [Acidimicrobiales bacterium]
MYQAEALVGEVVANVRYLNIDFCAEQYRGQVIGPRAIDSDEEWTEPTWRHPACDTVDFAVELETASGRRFTASWDSPGMQEGLGLGEPPAVGCAVGEDQNVAIWDVTNRTPWRGLIGRPVERVTLH